MKRSHKTWVSPFIAISSIVTSVTGILLFFHIKNGVIFSLHEWLGWAFVVISVIHLLLNWKPFICYFKKKAAYLSILAISVFALVLVFNGSTKQNDFHSSRPSTISAQINSVDAGSVSE